MIFMLLSLLAAPQSAHWDAMARANETASICSVRQGVRLDDKKTSPEIIARAAFAACNRELQELDESVKRNAAIEMPTVPQSMTEPAVQEHIRSMRKRIEDLVIQAVLEQRVRNAPNP